ncbi:nucleoside 2-deoxyribosyltransferase [Xanthomonas campestris]|uniref:nucleoside 2-deoxyribosyltransferase n=1 Tax=Xanthomonas campestris TaxID=339 RepID=UPI001CD7B2C4|nr:nucleoside 2-deoxyribosyltransferase [Xanthomonas campestris]
MADQLKGFFAYASQPKEIGVTIDSAIHDLHRYSGQVQVSAWPELDIPGRFIAETVLSGIDAGDFLVADITVLNFNVVYEIGYAIGKSKRVLIVRNEPYSAGSASKINELGIFDTLGYKSYENYKGLQTYLSAIRDVSPVPLSAELNKRAPVYLTQDKWKTDGATKILSRVRKARLAFRSFDPTEQPRLSALDAIQQVSQSYGVLVHLISNGVADHELSNLRGAFIAGLAQGMGKVLSILQSGADPVPLDYRDLIHSYAHPDQIDDFISEFAGMVYEEVQRSPEKVSKKEYTTLEKFDLGASSAENELRDLHNYYLPIDGYRRAQRGEVRLVVGRKGSGKTALFMQVRDRMRSVRDNVVLDLKPDGYRLIKFKDRVLKLLERGSFEHTITAFWDSLLWLETCHKVVEKDRDSYLYKDAEAINNYRSLASEYQKFGYEAQGDFAERMARLLGRIENDYGQRFGGADSQMLSTPQITELIYSSDIRNLQDKLLAYLSCKKAVWILFDNIDKGWSSRGISDDDLIIVKALVEATRKLERKIQRGGVEAHTLMFIRNDVFEILIDEMADRGKEPKALLDWTDSELLRQLILRRASYHSEREIDSFEQLWSQVCVSHIRGEETSQYLIDRSMMRPRYLIDLINHCRGMAITLGHERIDADDIGKGMNIFSSDLIADLSHEIRDVYPQGEDVLYAFIGLDHELSDDELRLALMEAKVPDSDSDHLIKILLWYGFLGCLDDSGEPKFIHDVAYNPKLLDAHRKKRSSNVKSFAISPAFWPALGIK